MKSFIAIFARAVLLVCGGAMLFNCIASSASSSGADANVWLIDARWAPTWLRITALSLIGATMASYGVYPRCDRWGRIAISISIIVLLCVAPINTLTFIRLTSRGTIQPGFFLPSSAIFGGAMIVSFIAISRGWLAPMTARSRVVFIATCGALLVAFPLIQMICFGRTDYRRRADVAIVFGARVYRDGRASDALRDRTTTACRLYRDGFVRKLIFSGGPGDGAIDEVHAMRAIALAAGVLADDIVLDPAGINTRATVANSARLMRDLGAHQALVVSHFYHLPRVKLAFQQHGCAVYTVPAECERTLRSLPAFMAREIAASWIYYLSGPWKS